MLKDILKIDNTPRMEEVINSPPSEHSSTSEAGPDSLEESKDQDAESLSLKQIPQIYEDRLGSIYRRHAGVIEMPFDDIDENEAEFNWNVPWFEIQNGRFNKKLNKSNE